MQESKTDMRGYSGRFRGVVVTLPVGDTQQEMEQDAARQAEAFFPPGARLLVLPFTASRSVSVDSPKRYRADAAVAWLRDEKDPLRFIAEVAGLSTAAESREFGAAELRDDAELLDGLIGRARQIMGDGR